MIEKAIKSEIKKSSIFIGQNASYFLRDGDVLHGFIITLTHLSRSSTEDKKIL